MGARSFKLFWTTHKWTGIVLALVFTMIATTGFLLLIKKRVDWIQPPTRRGGEGQLESFITMQELFAVVFAQGHADFRSLDDIDRVDFRPDKSVFKVRSRHHYAEIQVGAETGEVLSVSWRPSDLFERIHDGSFFGAWVHDWIMPVVPPGLLFLVFSGLWLWIEPNLRRKRRLLRRSERRQPASGEG